VLFLGSVVFVSNLREQLSATEPRFCATGSQHKKHKPQPSNKKTLSGFAFSKLGFQVLKLGYTVLGLGSNDLPFFDEAQPAANERQRTTMMLKTACGNRKSRKPAAEPKKVRGFETRLHKMVLIFLLGFVVFVLPPAFK